MLNYLSEEISIDNGCITWKILTRVILTQIGVDMNDVPIIVLSGGPCAGKTDGLAHLRRVLRKFGYTVFISPEAATDLIKRGMVPGKTVSSELFQELVFSKTLESEAACIQAAKALKNKKCVIICDRGVRDSLAYTSEEHFAQLAKKFGTHPEIIRDHRAHAVFHLRTTALGAERFYTHTNNTARRESIKEARILDELSLHVWVGHPHLRVIPNVQGGTFKKKKKRLAKEVVHFLKKAEIERKFLVELPDLMVLPYNARIPIIQHYLKKEKGTTHRVRARGIDSARLYTETKKTGGAGLSCNEDERVITRKEHHNLVMTALDRTRQPIEKHRHCFVWKDQYFELDIFESPQLPCAVLEIELLSENQEVFLPPFLKVIREVSHDPAWKNSTIAKRIPVLS